MNKAVPARAAALLDFLAVHESGGNYLAYYAHGNSSRPLPATIAAVLQFQHDLVAVQRQPSSAVGRYQFMPPTLTGLMFQLHLSPAAPFTNDLQDTLAFQLIRNRGYDGWVSGLISDNRFADNLSKEWASLPYNTGSSFYDHDGLNKSLVTRASFMAAIAKSKLLPH